jgi:hypothetical protein
VVLSRTFATLRRPVGGHEAGLEPPVPTGHPTPDRIGCHGLPDFRETVMRYASPVDPDSPTIQAHLVVRCFPNSAEVTDAAVTHITGRRSSI